MAFVKPPARNMPPGSEPWAQWVEEQMSSVTKQTVEAYQYAERAAGGVNSALEGNVQNRDEINRVFEVTEKSMQLADGAVVWSTLDPELPEDVPINPNVIWYTYDPETREVLRMWQWGYYDDVEGIYVEDWYQAQLGADSIHDEAITSAKVALGAIDWDQIAPDVENTVTTAQETAEKAATDAAQAKTDVITAINKANSAVVTADEAKTAANTAQTDATSAQTAAQEAKTAADTAKATADTTANDLLTLSGKTGRVIRSTTAPTGDDRNANNLWLNTTSGQLSEWNGSAWKVITDSRLTAATSAAATAQTRADQAANTAGAAQERADLAKDLADAAQVLAATADGKGAAAQTAANNAAAAAATAAGIADGKADVLIQSATPAAGMRKSTTLWIDTSSGSNTPKRWSGSAWVEVTDKAAKDAATAAAAAQSTADQAKSDAAAAGGKAIAAQAAATAAGSSAASAQSKADSAFTNAATAQNTASSAATAASNAQTKADTAAADLLALAGKSGRLIRSATAPTSADDKNVNNLWLNTGNGQLSQWTGSSWTLITDSRLTAATNAAATAQSTADTAKTNAATAQAKADSAFTNAATAKTAADNAMAAALGAQAKADTADAKASTADGRITIASANPVASDGVGKPVNAIWEVKSGSTVLRRFMWTGSAWTQVKAGQDFIGENAIGSAQIADVAVGTAQIADLAVTNGKIGDLAVDKLRVVGGATMPVAVIDSLVSDQAFIRNMYSSRVVVAADNLMPDPYFDLGTAVWSVGYATTAPGDTGLSSDVTYQSHPYSVRLLQKAAGTSNMALYAPLLRDSLSVMPTCTPGEKIVASCMYYLDKALPAGAIAGNGFDCRIYFYREDGTMLGNTSAGAVTTPPVGSWFQAGGNPLTVPNEAVRFLVRPTVYLNVGYTPNDAKVYIGQVEAKRQVGSVLIEDGAVTANKIVADAITARELAVGAITADKAVIANAAIKSAMIAEANILSAHIQDLAVTNAKIANTTITNAKILNLDAGKITTGFLDAARIQANSIVASKLAATAIDGMTITGSTIQTSSSANTGIKIDTANGLRAWAGGNLGVQISPSIKNGMAVRNPVGEMVPLSDAAFGTVSIARSNGLSVAAPQTSGAWSAWTRHDDTADNCILTFTAVSTRYIVSWSQSWATSYDSASSKQTGVQVGLSTGGSGNLIPSGNGGQITGLVGYLQERSADVGDRVRSVTMQGPLSTVVGQTYTLRMYFRYNANGPGTHNISVAARTITATPVY